MTAAYLATHITGDVGMSTCSKNRDSVTLDLELVCFRFLPVVLITVLKGENLAEKRKILYYIIAGSY